MSISYDQIQRPSRHVRMRAHFMWAVKTRHHGPFKEYRVTPYGPLFEHKEKTKRRILFDDDLEVATCTDWYTGEPCQANADYVLATGKPKTPRLCGHVWAADQTQEKYGRKEKKAA